MIQSGVPPSFWGEAVVYAAYTLNNLPYKQGSHATRNSLFYSQPPPTKLPHRLVPFGCAAWAKVDSDGKDLSTHKAIRTFVVGWDERRMTWRLITLDNHSRLKFSGHVTMSMDEFPCLQEQQDTSEVYDLVTDNEQCRSPVTPDPDEPPVTITTSRWRRTLTPSAQALRNIAGGDSAYFSHGEYTTTPEDWSYVSATYTDNDQRE